MPTRPGLGAFTLERELGRGGMGVVWLGAHAGTAERVAIKAVTSAEGERFRDAFEREVQAVASLSHPGIVSVYEQGIVTGEAARVTRGAFPEGSPFLAMEYAELGDLTELESPAWPHVREVLIQILEALAHAHATGIVHLDLKPENVLIQREGERGACVKLTDFGLAFASSDRRSGAHMHSSGVVGTPAYMSPEQFEGRWRDYGPWTDLYALGCVAYELISGRLPFTSKSLIGLANAHMNKAPPGLTPGFDVPEGVGAWLKTLLEKRPEARYATAADALHALLEISGLERTALTDRAFMSSCGVAGGAPTEVVSVISGPARTLDSRMLEASLRRTGDFGAPAVAATPAPAPMPRDWRAPGGAGEALPRLTGAGLGLWGVRALPMVGRELERDALWDALWGVSRDRRARAVVIRGPNGRGKTRLVEWFVRRARELGAADALEVTHAEAGGATDGLTSMFRARYGVAGLSGEDVRARMERVVALQHGADPPDPDELAWEARLWASWLTPNAKLNEAATRLALTTRALQRLARSRPVILSLDDAQWGDEGLGLAASLLDGDAPMGALVVLTVRDLELDPHDPIRAELDAVLEHERALVLDLGVLTPRAHEHLVQNLLGLSPALTEQVRVRTQGSPLFAVQLVHDLVSRGVLVVGEGGYGLVDGARVPIPEDIETLCLERLEYAASAVADSARALAALELAAVLGVRVRQDEWARACAASGLSPPREVLAGLVRSGVVWREREGWRFLNSMFAEALVARAQRGGRLEERHSACADALDVHAPGPSLGARRVEHLLGAGRVSEATRLLAEIIDQLQAPAAKRLFARFAGRLDALGPEDSVLYWCGCVGAMLLFQGHVEPCRQIVERCEDDAQVSSTSLSRWLSFSSRLELYGGDLERGFGFATRALTIARGEGSRLLEARATRVAGKLLTQLERHDEALEHTRRALQMFLALGELSSVAWCGYDEAMALTGLGRHQEALEVLERAERGLRDGQDPVASTYLVELSGVVAYELGDYARAIEAFESSVRSSEVQGDAGVWMSRENLARVLVKVGRHDEALAILERIDALPEQHRQNYYVNPVGDMLLTCWAAGEQWDLYDARVDQALAVEMDDAYTDGLDVLLDTLLALGERARAERVRWAAHGSWRALGDDARARQTLEKERAGWT